MGIIKEFKEFAVKGNAMDLAVGIIIGAAFGKIITSLVSDVIMPPIGLLMGGIAFSDKFLALDGETYASIAAAEAASAPIIKYGSFIDATINFLIIAFAVFMIVKGLNSMKRKEEEAPAKAPPEDVELLRDIRDELRKKNA